MQFAAGRREKYLFADLLEERQPERVRELLQLRGHRRLREVKRRVDPARRLLANHPIPPA